MYYDLISRSPELTALVQRTVAVLRALGVERCILLPPSRGRPAVPHLYYIQDWDRRHPMPLLPPHRFALRWRLERLHSIPRTPDSRVAFDLAVAALSRDSRS